MIKYATYNIYKNKVTGEIVRVPLTEDADLEKYASSEWEIIDEEEE